MQTRKYPRTLQEAFGPYCSPTIHDARDKRDDVVVMACAIAAVAAILILLVWG